MNHLVIYCHPNPNSFNHAIKETWINELRHLGHQVRVRDLYELGFDPVLTKAELAKTESKDRLAPVLDEQAHVRWSNVMTFIFPLWWAGMPAIAKGYIDRVLSEGFAYTFDKTGLCRLLDDKKAITLTTLGDTNENYANNGFFQAMDKLWDGITFDFAGITPLEHKYFGSVAAVGDEGRKKMLEEVKSLAIRISS